MPQRRWDVLDGPAGPMGTRPNLHRMTPPKRGTAIRTRNVLVLTGGGGRACFPLQTSRCGPALPASVTQQCSGFLAQGSFCSAGFGGFGRRGRASSTGELNINAGFYHSGFVQAAGHLKRHNYRLVTTEMDSISV